ncbi:MAG: DUF2867 domain-containing protein [Rhodanobacter sp.]
MTIELSAQAGPMDARRARSVELPGDSVLAHLFEGANLADAFAIVLPRGATHDINALACAVLGHPAPWVKMLLRLRDVAVASFGVKTSTHIRDEVRSGATGHIDFFRILQQSERELIVGEDDKHLDFKASLLVRPTRNGQDRELVATTVAMCHNRFGRAYIALIAPFHRLVVRSNLRRAALRGWA